MHLLGISLLLAYLLYTNLASDFSHSDYYDYYEQEQMDEPVSLRKKSRTRLKLSLAASVCLNALSTSMCSDISADSVSCGASQGLGTT